MHPSTERATEQNSQAQFWYLQYQKRNIQESEEVHRSVEEDYHHNFAFKPEPVRLGNKRACSLKIRRN
jgi:hypothetical protein